jgi:hypothetical protein
VKPLIITGFWAKKEEFEKKRQFLDLWLRNTPEADVLIIDNNEVAPLSFETLPSPGPRSVRVFRINNNLGAVDDFKGQFRPHLLGYSAGWIIGAMVAYSENRSFIYKEQDCLWFGDAEGEIIRRAETADLVAQLGYAVSAPARVETCLFWVRHDYITEFITKYMEQAPGDGVRTPEEKMEHISTVDRRVVPFGFGVGRDRPLPLSHPIWYAQRLTDEELDALSKKGLL